MDKPNICKILKDLNTNITNIIEKNEANKLSIGTIAINLHIKDND